MLQHTVSRLQEFWTWSHKFRHFIGKHPLARNVVIHIGTNDTAYRQSEVLKQDFASLFKVLKECNKSVFISGPIPSIRRGVERFSRLLSLNIWLQSVCCSHNLGFIDNFNLFWQPYLDTTPVTDGNSSSLQQTHPILLTDATQRPTRKPSLHNDVHTDCQTVYPVIHASSLMDMMRSQGTQNLYNSLSLCSEASTKALNLRSSVPEHIGLFCIGSNSTLQFKPLLALSDLLLFTLSGCCEAVLFTLSGCCEAVLFTLSGCCEAVLFTLSSCCEAVLFTLSGCCKAVLFTLSGCCEAVLFTLSSCCEAVLFTLSGCCEAVLFTLSGCCEAVLFTLSGCCEAVLFTLSSCCE
ncbi:hypothetical protein F7725_013457, partial [Dissostichus mawsoni]